MIFQKNIVIHEKPKIIKELKFKDFNLQEVDLTNKKGNIMIINFWASWCMPCRREMPSLEQLTLLNIQKLKFTRLTWKNQTNYMLWIFLKV